MSMNERQNEIIKLLSGSDYVTVEEFSRSLGVSKVTIRSDLNILEQKGLLMRTHGGAMIPDRQNPSRSISKTISEYDDEKDRIAKAAALLVPDRGTILVDSGSTSLHLSKYLHGRKLTLVTNSLLLIDSFRNDDSMDVVALGGTLKRNVMGMVGPMAISDVARVYADILFLGCTGYTNAGVFSSNLIEAELKQAMTKSSYKVCLIADSSKYGTKAMAFISSWDDIDVFITDSIEPSLREKLESRGVEVIIA